MSGAANFFKEIFHRRGYKPSHEPSPVINIGAPTDFKQDLHVGINKQTGMIEGMPEVWKDWIKKGNFTYVYIPGVWPSWPPL